MLKKVTKAPEYKEFRHQAKIIGEHLTTVYRGNEISLMLNLRKSYKSLFRNKGPRKVVINKMLDVLMISTGYFERLVALRVSLRELLWQADSLARKVRKMVQEDESFLKMSKQDRNEAGDYVLNPFDEVYDRINHNLGTVKEVIDFIDKMQFSLKTAIAALKERGERELHDRSGYPSQ